MNEQQRLPIIPITETVVFPGIDNRIFVNEVIGQSIKNLIIQNHTEAIGVTTKAYYAYDLLTEDSFYAVGVLISLEGINKVDNGYIMEIKTQKRVKISDVEKQENGLTAEYQPFEENHDLSFNEEEEIVAYIKEMLTEMSQQFKGADYFIKLLNDIDSIDTIMGYMVPMMGIPIQDKQELLEMSSDKERAVKFIDYIIREKDSVHLQIEISKKYARKRDKRYRESMLREQLKNIQEELGDDESDQESYREKVEAANLPETVRTTALKEVKKLESAAPGSAEINVIQNYLDLLLDLPWYSDAQSIDIGQAREILDKYHYGIEEVKKRIIEHLAVMKLKKESQGSILLLVGPPGTGKTSLGRSIAEALGRKYVRASLGGIRDESEIRGHRRTYVGAMPGRIIKGIQSAQSKNPVFILDEIDKLGMSNQGDPSAALLEVLDPEQNSTFADHYLEVPYDLSDVFFIATANDVSTIPKPLLDRTEIIEMSSYTNNEKFHIAKEHIIPKVIKEHGLEISQLAIQDDAVKMIISDYTAEAGVRGLTKQFEKITRGVVEKIVTEECENVEITPENLKEYLGTKTRRHEKATEENRPGVVTGMAWTAVGGEILFTEATLMPGSGRLMLTGQLGDVMKESAEIAMSLLRSRFCMTGTPIDFSKCDVHIHVPAGATPKDGPSAGVTLFTALASLILGKSVDSKLAMTGEITLSGQVLPVGGIKEKVMAAQRGGIQHILLPEENIKDLDDVPDEIKQELTFTPVNSIEAVIKEALDYTLPAAEYSNFLFKAVSEEDMASIL